MGATGAAGAIQAYMEIKYEPVNTDEDPSEGPDLIRLDGWEHVPNFWFSQESLGMFSQLRGIGPRSSVDMQQEVMDALKEIPALVKCVRDLITTMKRMQPVMDTDNFPGQHGGAGQQNLFQKTKPNKNVPVHTGLSCAHLWAGCFGIPVDTVIAEFPGTNVPDVRAVILRKYNNEHFVINSKQ
ncbi:unnamed protein product [Boreogadus saida]